MNSIDDGCWNCDFITLICHVIKISLWLGWMSQKLNLACHLDNFCNLNKRSNLPRKQSDQGLWKLALTAKDRNLVRLLIPQYIDNNNTAFIRLMKQLSMTSLVSSFG